MPIQSKASQVILILHRTTVSVIELERYQYHIVAQIATEKLRFTISNGPGFKFNNSFKFPGCYVLKTFVYSTALSRYLKIVREGRRSSENWRTKTLEA